ncbi:aldehyde dehydrogenase family protein [Eionea flava]
MESLSKVANKTSDQHGFSGTVSNATIARTSNRSVIDVINPATQAVVDSVYEATNGDVDAALANAKHGVSICRGLARYQRADILMAAAKSVQQQLEVFARLIVQESGKTIMQARKEVSRCINTLTLSAEEAKRLQGEEIAFDSYEGAVGRQGYTQRDPLGVIVAITPFNDPLNLVAHKLGPAIAGGNAVILKPSEQAPLSALKLVDTLVNAGLDERIISVVVGGADVGRQLISADIVRMVSFTGGMSTGEAITRTAGLKKMSMDLGGNAPVIVMADSDIHTAVDATVSGAFWASGQNCIGTQRILIERSAFDRFVSTFVAQTQRLRVGDPMDESVDVGPMINVEQAMRIESWVNDAIAQGATLLAGHRRTGSFYPPTVLSNVPADAQLCVDEVFAPVVILDVFDTFEEAVSKANSVDYSLHAGIFTNNLEVALTAVDRLEASGVMVNDSSDFRFDAMPFGGYKRGSLGREGVRYALEEMTQTKVVCFNRTQ